MISKEEVEHIAKLARLELTEAEVGKMQKDLSAILDYFALLKKAPKVKVVDSGKPQISGMIDLRAARKDEMRLRDEGVAEKLVAGAPDKKDGYIKVKTIL